MIPSIETTREQIRSSFLKSKISDNFLFYLYFAKVVNKLDFYVGIGLVNEE